MTNITVNKGYARDNIGGQSEQHNTLACAATTAMYASSPKRLDFFPYSFSYMMVVIVVMVVKSMLQTKNVLTYEVFKQNIWGRGLRTSKLFCTN